LRQHDLHINDSERELVAMNTRWARLTAAALLLIASGCNRSGLDLVDVAGVVKYDGKPLAGAGVVFVPSQGLPAMDITDNNGEFSLITANQDGARVGEYRVSVSKTQTIEIPQRYGYPEYKTNHLIPQKYSKATTSGLTATVNDDENYFEFNLTGS
jgi:hypothetical protein